MSKLEDFVDVQITRETEAVSRASFSIPCFIASHTRFSERARTYNDLDGIAEDFLSSSDVYVAAQRYFGQQIVPRTVVIGRRQVDGVDGTVTVANNTEYSITVNGEEASITSDGSATALEIIAALKVDVDALAIAGLTFTDNLDGTFDIDITAGTAWSITSSSNVILVEKASTEAWPDTIEAVQDVNDTWYYLSTDSHVDADVLAIAGYIQTQKKLYAFSSSASDIKTAVTTDIFSQLKALSYDRTFGLWSALADTQFPECAWVGSQAQATPGSNTWAFKNLVGVTPDVLTSNETTNLRNKNANTYETIGGINRTTEGKTVQGEYIDVMVGVDWTVARMKEAIWFVLANSPKVPYTNSGLAQLETQVRKVLAEGTRNGLYTDNPPYFIVVPDVATIDVALKATRTVEDITFEATLAGAIHKVVIRGRVGL